jgi:hypothetical protein
MSRVEKLFVPQALGETLRESIAAEIAPEVPTATQHLAVPVDLRHVPELMADGLHIIFAVPRLIILARCGVGIRPVAHLVEILDRRELRIPSQLGVKFHGEFARHLARCRQLMLIMTEHDELPDEPRKRRAVLLLERVDGLDVGNHLREIAAHAIDRICFGTGAVDRTDHRTQPMLHDAFEQFGSHRVEIGAVQRGQRYLALLRQRQDVEQVRIEKDFSVIGQLDHLQRQVLVEQLAEIIESQEAAADRGMDCTARRRTGWTAELAKGGSFEPNSARRRILGPGLHFRADPKNVIILSATHRPTLTGMIVQIDKRQCIL